MGRTLRTAAALALLPALLGACTLFGGSSLPSVGGEWEGGVEVQGQAVQGELTLEQDGQALVADFRAPSFGLVASGFGRVAAQGTVTMTLEYDLQCEGTAELSGRVSPDGRRIEGSVTASDCTGSVEGTFVFTR